MLNRQGSSPALAGTIVQRRSGLMIAIQKGANTIIIAWFSTIVNELL
jgi:hypothetical protein